MNDLRLNRRQLLKSGAAVTLAAAAASSFPAPAVWAAGQTVKIGFVTPQTGPIAIFAEPDAFALEQVKKATGGQIKIDGRNYPLEIIVKDSQSNSNRASEVAVELMTKDQVNLITATSTPETTNPVASQAELAEVPCLTNDTPWQPHFFGRGGDPKKGFNWTYHFFWGLEDVIAVYQSIWSKGKTNGVVGALWPNDADGNAWGDPAHGFPGPMAAAGQKLTDTGRFDSMNDNFAAQISAFKAANVEIVTGVIPPPTFVNFYSQAAQQGFKPKIVTVGKALEFPQAVGAVGERGHGLSVEVWWSPQHPFTSGMTKQSSAELAADYTKTTGRPWTMPLAFKRSLFEVALDALQRSGNPFEPAKLRDALKATSYNSIVGKIDFSKGPVPNIAKTPLVGGQWSRSADGKFDLAIVENSQFKDIPVAKELFLI